MNAEEEWHSWQLSSWSLPEIGTGCPSSQRLTLMKLPAPYVLRACALEYRSRLSSGTLTRPPRPAPPTPPQLLPLHERRCCQRHLPVLQLAPGCPVGLSEHQGQAIYVYQLSSQLHAEPAVWYLRDLLHGTAMGVRACDRGMSRAEQQQEAGASSLPVRISPEAGGLERIHVSNMRTVQLIRFPGK